MTFTLLPHRLPLTHSPTRLYRTGVSARTRHSPLIPLSGRTASRRSRLPMESSPPAHRTMAMATLACHIFSVAVPLQQAVVTGSSIHLLVKNATTEILLTEMDAPRVVNVKAALLIQTDRVVPLSATQPLRHHR